MGQMLFHWMFHKLDQAGVHVIESEYVFLLNELTKYMNERKLDPFVLNTSFNCIQKHFVYQKRKINYCHSSNHAALLLNSSGIQSHSAGIISDFRSY